MYADYLYLLVMIAHMNISFIIKLKILRIIRWSCRSPKLLNEPKVVMF